MTFDGSTTYYRKARDEKAYLISEIYQVASGATQNIHLKNPDGSGRRYWVMEGSVTSDGPYIAQFHDGFSSAPTGGNALEIQNVLLDSDNTDIDGSADANNSVTYTSNSTHAVGVGGGGSGGQSLGFPTQHPPIVMEENREVVLEIENTGTEQNYYALTIVYYETSM